MMPKTYAVREGTTKVSITLDADDVEKTEVWVDVFRLTAEALRGAGFLLTPSRLSAVLEDGLGESLFSDEAFRFSQNEK